MPYEPRKEEPKLRVKPKVGAMVPVYGGTHKRFVGLTLDPHMGAEYKEIDDKGKETGKTLKQAAVCWHSEVVELPNNEYRGEYIRALKDGSLWPADEATAAEAGVAFDPNFGGEHDGDDAVAEVEAEPVDMHGRPRLAAASEER